MKITCLFLSGALITKQTEIQTINLHKILIWRIKSTWTPYKGQLLPPLQNYGIKGTRFQNVYESYPVITTLVRNSVKILVRNHFNFITYQLRCKISVLLKGLRICINICTPFFGFGSYRPVCLKKAHNLEVFY